MRDHLGIPLLRGVPLSGDRLRSNPSPEPSTPPRPFSLGHWQGCLFLTAGLVAAILMANTAVRSIVGLSSAERSTEAMASLTIPSFAELLECNAHFSHEIQRIKNAQATRYANTDLSLLHRNYRRLYRVMRQVGRRDGIAPRLQTDRFRKRVAQLHAQQGAATNVARHESCQAMAAMPVASKRNSQRIVGR